MPSRKDEFFMRRCLDLALKGWGMTNPNPMVGAVIVKNGKIIAEGWHKRAGLSHAEIIALRKAKDKAKNATLYVNLEPCSSYGRTPPCVEEIIKSGVKKVVIACPDPNPLNKFKGIRKLRARGIEVKVGVLKREAQKLNKIFFKYMEKKLPYVTIKFAQSLDGKIATSEGNSYWISSQKARRFLHFNLRKNVDAIVVGINTVIKDDPLLTARYNGRPFKKQPLRIILDSKLRIPLKAKLIKTKDISGVLIVTTSFAPEYKKIKLIKKGIEVIQCKEKKGMVDLKDFLRKIALKEISHILVEGGARLITSFIEEKLADDLFIFVSPLILGGNFTSVGGKGFKEIRNAPRLKSAQYIKIGDELLIHGEIAY